MVLVVREALVYLRLGEHRKAGPDETVDGLTVLQETNDVMHANPGALNARVAPGTPGDRTMYR